MLQTMTELTTSLARRLEAADYLHIGPSSLRHWEPYLHRLRLPDGQYRLARPYLEYLHSVYSGQARHGRVGQVVRELAVSHQVRRTVEEGEAEFEIDLRQTLEPTLSQETNGGAMVNRDKLATLLEVSQHAINGWRQTEAAGAFQTHNSQLYLGETALRSAVNWYRPLGYPGEPSISLDAARSYLYDPADRQFE